MPDCSLPALLVLPGRWKLPLKSGFREKEFLSLLIQRTTLLAAIFSHGPKYGPQRKGVLFGNGEHSQQLRRPKQ